MLISAGRRCKISTRVTNVPSGSSVSFGRDQGTHGPLHHAEESVGRYGRDERGSAPPGSVRPSWDVDIVTEDEVQREEAGSVGRRRPGPTCVQRMVSSRQESGFLAEMEMFASLRVAMLSPGLLHHSYVGDRVITCPGPKQGEQERARPPWRREMT